MLSIGKLAAGQHAYYLDAVAQAREDYYVGAGEAPGRWSGGGAATLGLNGQVRAEDFTALFSGQDPRDVDRTLGALPANWVPGFDVTLSAPKSVSVLWALGDEALSGRMRQAHDDAVAAAMTYLERTAAFGRRGKGGRQRIATTGFVAGVFRHRTSRAGDMNLHSHVVISNRVLGVDGKWSALDGSLLYRQGMATAAIYRAQLRENLRDLGLDWTMREDGLAELTGVPRHVLRHFSKRRQEIEARMAARGLSGPGGAQAAALDTRRAKDYGVDEATLEFRWLTEALSIGYGREQIGALLAQGMQASEQASQDRTAEERAAVDVALSARGLTDRRSTFDERDLIRELARQLPHGASLATIERLTRECLDAHPEVVRLSAGESSLRRSDLPTGMAEARYSTVELMALEQDLVESAVARERAHVAQVRPDVAGLAIGEARGGRGLSGEQAHLVRALTMDGHGVAVVNALAGSGKTTALGASTKAWQREGIPVIGTCLSAKAAGILHDETGMRTFTTARLLLDLADPRWEGFAPGTVLVVDEAGQVGSRALHAFHEQLQACAGKLVLVGDDRQLPEIDAGGAFRGLSNRLDTVRLVQNRRQSSEVIRERLAELRAGPDPAGALGGYDTDGLVHRAADASALTEQMVADWSRPWLAVDGEQARADVVMLALTNADVAELNGYARVLLADAGVLTGDELLTERTGFRTGDHVVTRQNDARLGVKNGDRWVVEAVDVDAEVLAVRRVGGGERVVLPGRYVHDGHVQHGYAITVSIAQGLTVDRAFVRGSDTTYREALYVAASRARHETRFYVVAAEGEDLGCEHAHGSCHIAAHDVDPFVELQAAAGRSRAQTLAVDTMSQPEVEWASGVA